MKIFKKIEIKKLLPNILALLILGALSLSSILIFNFHLWPNGKKIPLFMGGITVILYFLIFKLFQAIFNRYWLSLGITLILDIFLIISTFLKLQLRKEPILPSDLTMIKDLPAIVKMVNPVVLIAGLAILVIILVAAFLLDKYRSVPKLKLIPRIGWTVASVIVFSSVFFWNHTDSLTNKIVISLKDDPILWNQAQGMRRNGPLIQFFNNVDVSVMDKPKDYSEQTMNEINKHYSKAADQINKKRKNKLSNQTIIFNLSESFADPRRVPGVKLSANPIPQIDRIKSQTTSGLMMSSGYGGGTANMEYMTLTGFATCNFSPTLTTPYSQLVPRQTYTPTILDSFNYSIAIHPYTNEFYNRAQNYKKFGFNRFYSLSSKKYTIKHKYKIDNNQYLSDKTAYANLMDVLKSYKKGKFINLITMQNHLPFTNLYKNHPIKGTAKYGTTKDELENYSTGINYTDKVVAHTLKQINKINRPVTLVFYGDHLPGFYKNDMMKDGIKLHETDYFIWSNKAACKNGARRLTSRTKYVSPSNFIAMMAKQTNSKITPYQALLTEIYDKLPAFSVKSKVQNSKSEFVASQPQFINNDGKTVNESSFTSQQKKLWHDYLLVQYDLTAGKTYLKNTGMMR